MGSDNTDVQGGIVGVGPAFAGPEHLARHFEREAWLPFPSVFLSWNKSMEHGYGTDELRGERQSGEWVTASKNPAKEINVSSVKRF